MFRARGLLVALTLTVACGTGEGSPSETATNESDRPGPPGANVLPTNTAVDAGPSELSSDPWVGLWQVKGTDARGAYEGEVEVRADGAGYRFIRAVSYPGQTVEDGRELHWLFTGTLRKNGEQMTLAASLKRLDFVVAHAGVTRSSSDVPLPLAGSLALSSNRSEVTGTIAGDGIALGDTWSARKPLPIKPIFTDERVIVPAHRAPTPAEKQANFSLYSGFHALAVIKPYVGRPEFQAAVHGHTVDTTDLEFYRTHKNALRVVGKIIDPISLVETRARADAYRLTLHDKAVQFDHDVETRFLDPTIGMIPHGCPPGGGFADQYQSGDGALWTGMYLASQVFRHRVTGEAQALANVELTLDALLRLQEITGDWAHFARSVRKATGSDGEWHAGTGAYASLDWLEGGNNDMVKGLFYGYLLGWETFCEGGKTGHAALCARIRTNAKHLADDLQFPASTVPTSQVTNTLPTTWLYAIVTDNPIEAATYKTKAEGLWAVAKTLIAQTPVYYSQGIVDWSGQSLSSVGDYIGMAMAKHIDLGGDAAAVYRAHIDASHHNLEQQRFPNWHLLKAALGTGAGPSSPFIKDAVSRLIEVPVPKVQYTIDRRLTPEFCMSPYPSLPWKGDWADPKQNRTQGLVDYPLFEMHTDVLNWKVGNDYVSYEGLEAPGSDFLHLYWLGRLYGLLGPND